MGLHKETELWIDAAHQALEEYHPRTLRGLYYNLLSKEIIPAYSEPKKARAMYGKLSRCLVIARQRGMIPWNWIEDTSRIPHEVSMWDDLSDFGADVIRAYRGNVWNTQPNYLEVWVEKDTMMRIFTEAVKPYGVAVNIGRGYDGWDSIYKASERYKDTDKPTTILYFGDYDPAGEDMFRSLQERLGFFHTSPEIVKCAITPEQIRQYKLPMALPKDKDTKSKRFTENSDGLMCVELDALSVPVLQTMAKEEIEARLDMEAYRAVLDQDEKERQQIVQLFSNN
jgi:hypothetical protein